MKTETKNIELADGYKAEINGTRVHLHKDGKWIAMTDHAGTILRVAPLADRAKIVEKVFEGLRAAGIVKPATAPAPLPAAKPARAANWRCPNKRDCGDPSCDGNCGY